MDPQLQPLIEKATNDVKNLLNRYGNSKNLKDVKKSKLLSYWLSDYCRLLKKEETFIPAKSKKYKRGDILQAHLGFNIGCEESGLHYVVAINNDIPASSDIITVIPLTSKKKNYKPSRYTIDLGDIIYSQLKEKYDNAFDLLSQEISALVNEISGYDDSIISYIEKLKLRSLSDKKLLTLIFDDMTIQKSKINQLASLKTEMEFVEKAKEEIGHMKSGSIALVSQITTISKVRIYNPITKHSTLHGIRLSAENMDKLDDTLKKLYTK